MYLKLFTSCKVTQGANCSLISDVQRGLYFNIPNTFFDIIKNTDIGFNNEIQLTDALAKLDKSIGVITKCKQYDIGNKLNWIKSNIELSMQRDEFSSELKVFLKTLI